MAMAAGLEAEYYHKGRTVIDFQQGLGRIWNSFAVGRTNTEIVSSPRFPMVRP